MKKIAFSLFVFLSVASLQAQQATDSFIEKHIKKTDYDQRYMLGDAYPDFTVTTLDGQQISKSELAGKIVFINFWFESCPPCVAELQALNEMYERLKDKDKFVYLSFSSDSEKSIKSSIEKHKIPYPVYAVNSDVCGCLYVKGFPTNLILDQEGRLVFLKTGGTVNKKATFPQVKAFEELILELLETL